MSREIKVQLHNLEESSNRVERNSKSDLAQKDTILLATLNNIAFDGWTDQALYNGAVRTGTSAETISLLFPGGVYDLITHFNDWANRKMQLSAESAGEVFFAQSLPNRIGWAIRARFEALEPYREAIQRVLVLLVLPSCRTLLHQLVVQIIDAIWHIAGNRPTDFSFYIQRVALSGVLVTTTLCWLNDCSEDKQPSWHFLDRQLAYAFLADQTTKLVAKSLAQLAEAPWRLIGTLRANNLAC
jgi:ubiquinone biosynthesis protein COQ9